jgi:hypothetical protein
MRSVWMFWRKTPSGEGWGVSISTVCASIARARPRCAVKTLKLEEGSCERARE